MTQELTPDICVVGGGPGGVAAALAAVSAGAPVVLVEKGAMGGANLAWGSVPFGALSAAAEVNAVLTRGPALGVSGAPLQVDFAALRGHISAVEGAIAANVSAERLTALGVQVISAAARFVDRDTLSAGEFTIRARRYVLATGAEPIMPVIPGLDGVDCLTVATAFALDRKPAHLVVYGADREGLALAQAFSRLGVGATIVDRGEPLPGEDPELVAIVLDRLRAEGIRIRTGLDIISVGRRRGGVRFTVSDPQGGDAAIDGAALLIASGRRPAVAGLDLANAGIEHGDTGITVDRSLRTTNRRVYAIGDAVAGPAQVARARQQAAAVIRTIVYRVPRGEDAGAAPAVVFTDPAIATVGLGEAEARARHGAGVRVLRLPFIENDRAQIERQPSGFIKVVVGTGGRVLGAGIVGTGAAEMIALWSLAVANRLPLSAIAELPVPYPTRSAIARRVASLLVEEKVEAGGLIGGWRTRILDLMRKLG
jgi:pyruvate/2-oxoglutarate dehydrogenase complex dihydrolipoamide dehydrogenase (E3) component